MKLASIIENIYLTYRYMLALWPSDYSLLQLHVHNDVVSSFLKMVLMVLLITKMMMGRQTDGKTGQVKYNQN